MMLNFKNIALLFLVFSLRLNTYAQTEKKLDKAEKLFINLEYSLCIKKYEKLFHYKKFDSLKNIHHILNLADAYAKTKQYYKAKNNYLAILKKKPNYYSAQLKIADVLIRLKSIDEANEYVSLYLKTYPNDSYANNLYRSILEYNLLDQANEKYTISNLNINTSFSDFGAVEYNKGIVFSSNGLKNTSLKKYKWTDQPYYELYYSEKQGQNDYADFANPISLSDAINKTYHDGPIWIENGNKYCWVTANQKSYKKFNSNLKDNVLGLYLYQIESNGEFKFIKEFEYNRPTFSVGHAWFDEQLQMLFFVSDKPGGFGGTDLYISRKINENWSTPVNLGKTINTAGNEMFPFIINHQLYFSSDGLVGLGGLDIYVSNYNGYFWSYPQNLKSPINSSMDDFSFFISEIDEDEGFFSSDRPNGKGCDDIYFFKSNENFYQHLKIKVIENKTKKELEFVDVYYQKNLREYKAKTNQNGELESLINPLEDYEFIISKPNYHTKKFLYFHENFEGIKNNEIVIQLEPEQWLELKGKVFDEEQNIALDSAKVILTNQTYQLSEYHYTDKNGLFNFTLDTNCQYQIFVQKEGYFNEQANQFNTEKMNNTTLYYDLYLHLNKIHLNQAYVLKNIYYETDQWDLNEDSKKELDKIVKILNQNPYIVIELSSHTDSRASFKYNLELSNKRALEAFKYIVSKGIAHGRVKYKGYGEKYPINRCTNNSPCSEEEFRINRRTEFKVITY
ncbi:MAG: OmpA family protein [Bacteroidales bacterium]|nr:OmpA family protein [Bacteroidales bacterium]